MDLNFDLSEDEVLVQRLIRISGVDDSAAKAMLSKLSERFVKVMKYHPPPPMYSVIQFVPCDNKLDEDMPGLAKAAAKLMLARIKERVDEISCFL